MNGIDIRITLLLHLFITQAAYFANMAVLDPALHLYPVPPLSPSSGSIQEWNRTSRSTKFQHLGISTSKSKETTTATSVRVEQESMENAETFWPRLHSIDYSLKQIHVPVAFSLSGNHGGYRGAGIIGKAYASIGRTELFGYGKTGLAGTDYGTYGSPVRVYSGNNGPAWSGWGNGKWGHYGKG